MCINNTILLIEYTELKALFESERIDLAVCDSFTVSCIDTAIVSNLPVIITSTFGLYAGNIIIIKV
jgi:hypothetical protein